MSNILIYQCIEGMPILLEISRLLCELELVFLDGPSARMIEKMRIAAHDFQPLKVIGRGAFGEVQLVRF